MTSKTTIRSFGQIRLCGALHICWQTRGGVEGQYMVCLLYKECLCLALASKVDQFYIINACIGLNTIKIEEADNGRGKGPEHLDILGAEMLQDFSATLRLFLGSSCSKSITSSMRLS
jgi:hypothetical protein